MWLIPLVVVAGVTAAVLLYRRYYHRSALANAQAWLEEQGVESTSVQRATFFRRGPYTFGWQGMVLHRIVVRTASGAERSGWLNVVALMAPEPSLKYARVAWDDEVEADGTPADGGIPHIPRRMGLAAIGGVWLGAAIGALLDPVGMLFFSIWGSGIVCGALGLLLGLAWHMSDPLRRRKTHLGPVLFLCGVVLFLTLIMGVMGLTGMRNRNLLTRLQQQAGQGITKLEIYDADDALLAKVEEPESIATLGEICRTVLPGRSERPGPGGTYYSIRIDSQDPMEIRFSTDSKHPGEVRGTFVDRGEMAVASYGDFRSEDLLGWLEQVLNPKESWTGQVSVPRMNHPLVADDQEYFRREDGSEWLIVFGGDVPEPDRQVRVWGTSEEVNLGGAPGTRNAYRNTLLRVERWEYVEAE